MGFWMPEASQGSQRLPSFASIPRYKQILFPLTMLLQFPSSLLTQGTAFYQKQHLHWAEASILLMQVMVGVGIVCGGWIGGQIAHRRHPAGGIRLGLLCSALVTFLIWYAARHGQIGLYVAATACFGFAQAVVWAPQESSIMNGEPSRVIQRYVGAYNVLWAAAASLAFFCASPVMRKFGTGAFFIIPLVIYVFNLVVVHRFLPDYEVTIAVETPSAFSDNVPDSTRREFRRLGWIANPLACFALTVVIAFSPKVCQSLQIPDASASSWSSIWFYMRTATFILLSFWTGWRYQKNLLFAAMLFMMGAVAGCVLAPSLFVFVAAQLAFGFCTGLMYQSSLFYSMAGSDTQGEHGGMHEMALGLGLTAGPLCGWLGAMLTPGDSRLSVMITLLVMGGGVVAMGKKLALVV